MFETPDVPGASDVVAWFGYWPTFHDAEVLSITLDRLAGCRVAIHAFESTPEVDSSGCYVHAKHAVVTFHLEALPETITASHWSESRASIIRTCLAVRVSTNGRKATSWY